MCCCQSDSRRRRSALSERRDDLRIAHTSGQSDLAGGVALGATPVRAGCALGLSRAARCVVNE